MSRKQLLISACLLTVSLSFGVNALAQSDAERREAETAARALSLVVGGNFLGVRTESVTRETMGRYNLSGEPRGVAVTSVVADSPAAKAGLQQNDVILRFDGEAVSSPQKLQRLISESAPGHTARLTISRGGSERELTATLARREGTGGAFGLLRTPDGQEFRWNDEGWKKHAEEFERYQREWQKNGEEWRKRSEEFQRQLERMPRGHFSLFRAGRRIGVQTTALTEQLADYFGVSERRGLLVTSVTENSPAAKAGIKAGDVIVEAEGEKVSAAGELSRVINRRETGDVAITIVRDRNRRTIRVTPEKSEAPTTFVVPDGLFAPSIGALTSGDTLIGPSHIIRLPELRRMTPMHLPRLNITPRVIAPRRLRESVIL